MGWYVFLSMGKASLHMASFSGNESPSIDLLALRIHAAEAREVFGRVHWKSLKEQLASTTAIDLAGVAAKLGVLHDGVQTDAHQLDLDILRSAITDLRLLSPDC